MNFVRRIRHLGQPSTKPVHDESDADLVSRYVLTREESAFAELLRRHGPLVAGVCQRVLAQQQDAEDAMQATFFVLARDAWRISQRESVGSWLFGVALRLARRARQMHQRERQARMQATRTLEAPSEPMLLEAMDEVACLPEPYRTPVVLCWLEGRTQQEAAQLLGWPLGSVAGRLARAKEMLKPRLLRRGLAPTALAMLSCMSVSNSLAEEQLAATVRQALGESQSAFIRTLAKSSVTPWWMAGVLCVALVTGGLGWWWTNVTTTHSTTNVTMPAIEELTNDKLQGQWIITGGGWDTYRFKGGDFQVMIKGNTLTFEGIMTEVGALRRPDFANFNQLKAWGTPLAFTLSKQHIDLNFPYPYEFLQRNFGRTTTEPFKRIRLGLVRLEDGILELAIGCNLEYEFLTPDQINADVPRPTEYTIGPKTFYMKLRRMKPEEQLQGWWLHTAKHEVTQDAVREDFLVVRDNKLAKVTAGYPMGPASTLKLEQRGPSLIVVGAGDLVLIGNKPQPNEQLVHLTDHSLKLATFGKYTIGGRDAEEMARTMFNNIDRDKSGKLSQEQLPGFLRDRFTELDVNKDGFIVLEEFTASTMFQRRGGRNTSATFTPCAVPAGVTWDNLESYRKDYIIQIIEYARSSKEQYQQRLTNAPATTSQSTPSLPTTLPKLFRVEPGDHLATLAPEERVQLQCLAKPGAAPVTLLDQVAIKEVAKLTGKDGKEQLAVTLLLTPNEARLLELFLDGGTYQLKRGK